VDSGQGVGPDRPDVPHPYTLRGTSYPLHRIGCSVQVPAHRAVERDEQAIATWRREVWPVGKR
jgi:putative transposase